MTKELFLVHCIKAYICQQLKKIFLGQQQSRDKWKKLKKFNSSANSKTRIRQKGLKKIESTKQFKHDLVVV